MSVCVHILLEYTLYMHDVYVYDVYDIYKYFL